MTDRAVSRESEEAEVVVGAAMGTFVITIIANLLIISPLQQIYSIKPNTFQSYRLVH